MGYFAYFQTVKSEDFINSSYNARQDSFSSSVVRGKILGANGEVLAQSTVSDDGTETRNYPYANLFSHVVGYSTNGKLGIESSANFNLLRSNSFFLERMANGITNQKNVGDNVITTLDVGLQQAAYDALGSYEGAVVVMEPSTGRVLAMVSKPDFDPNEIATNWESISGDSESSVLVNRATQGAYPPGSTFKIVTALEYMKEHPDYENYAFDCRGVYDVESSTIHCFGNTVHNSENLRDSFVKSCNTSFSNIGLELNKKSYRKLCEDLLFNKKLPGAFDTKKSSFALEKSSSIGETMQTAIGQGQTLTSPYHMLLITSAIANNGILMNPYIIDHTENKDGELVKQFESSEYGELLDPSQAQILQDYMRGVVEEGTASGLQGTSYTASGKTGSAEINSNGDSHAWFVGFASLPDSGKPDIAIAVIAEGAGTGGKHAVPIAKAVFDAYYAQ
ncbi:MAG: penicillin-binding protein 2 [Lachnospiraceae bacterium]|nr:penicillin-binding protein 2 [Lachnospiraceae bacterium]